MHSASFCPCPAAWRNISCSTNDWWGVPRPHWGYSSRKSHLFQLPKGDPLLFCPFLGHQGPLHASSIMQSQNGQITREIIIAKTHLSTTMKIHNHISHCSIKKCRSTALWHHLPTSQFLKLYFCFVMLPFLTQTSLDHLSNYFTTL